MFTKDEKYLLRLRSTTGASVDPVEGDSLTENRLLMIRPDKPCHKLRDSLLSSSSGNINFKGFTNIFNALLVLSIVHFVLQNIIKYGILVNPVQWPQVFFYKPIESTFGLILLGLNVFPLSSLGIEVLLSKGLLSEKAGMAIITALVTSELLIPLLILHIKDFHLFVAFTTMLFTLIIFLKLISYHMTNFWCREIRVTEKEISHHSISSNRERRKDFENANVKRNLVHYPDNLNFKDLYYFMFAPTLCYELNFPRTACIRKTFLVKRALEMLFLVLPILCLIQQFLVPTFNDTMKSFNEMDYLRILENLLKAPVPTVFGWLMISYFFYHSYLNIVAEILRFGDRHFYDDYWNAETMETYWHKWNIVVHQWSLRHLYIPFRNCGFNNWQTSFLVFLVSAVLHEYMAIASLKVYKMWMLMGFLMHVPYLVFFEKYMHNYFGYHHYGFTIMGLMSMFCFAPFCAFLYYRDAYLVY